MISLIAAAAIAAAQPAAVPADTHAQHQQTAPQGHEQHQMMAQMGEKCCCKEMMEKMHSGHEMDRTPDHQEHHGN